MGHTYTWAIWVTYGSTMGHVDHGKIFQSVPQCISVIARDCAILEVDTASHSGLLYAAEGENILYFTIEMITFFILKFCGSVSELIWAYYAVLDMKTGLPKKTTHPCKSSTSAFYRHRSVCNISSTYPVKVPLLDSRYKNRIYQQIQTLERLKAADYKTSKRYSTTTIIFKNYLETN